MHYKKVITRKPYLHFQSFGIDYFDDISNGAPNFGSNKEHFPDWERLGPDGDNLSSSLVPHSDLVS
jgi:hypothetical protein